ncbi:MAG: acyl-CoA thioesterase [Planctomycetes bacterium]|nr:acyl-CoA thioesterase [Planctomycetota bacterium]
MAAVHQTSVRVRYAETDRMGIVYHANYFQYFEIGRTEAMRSLGATYRSLEDQGFALAVVECGANFRAGAKYDDELRIVTRPSGAGRIRVRFDYEIWCGEKLMCEGFTVLACLKAGRPTELPDEIRQMIAVAQGA